MALQLLSIIFLEFLFLGYVFFFFFFYRLIFLFLWRLSFYHIISERLYLWKHFSGILWKINFMNHEFLCFTFGELCFSKCFLMYFFLDSSILLCCWIYTRSVAKGQLFIMWELTDTSNMCNSSCILWFLVWTSRAWLMFDMRSDN